MQIAGIETITIETSLIIVIILLLRKYIGERIHPLVMKFLWVVPALRILLPIEIPADILGLERLSECLEVIAKFRLQVLGISFFQGVVIWLSGSLIVFFLFAIKNYKFGRMLKQNRHVHGKKDGILVYFVNRKIGSCLEGLLFPKIYISRLAEERFDWCTWIVRHELCHYYAGDNWYGLVRTLCLLFQWYNPLVWYAAKCSVEDCEIACDYRVLKGKTLEEQIIYGKCLVAMAAGKTESFWEKPVTGSSLEDGSLKKRIERLGNKGSGVKALEFMCICGLLCVLAFSYLGGYDKENTIINVLDRMPIIGEKIFCYQLEEPTAENMEQTLQNMKMRNWAMDAEAFWITKADRESVAVVFPLFEEVYFTDEKADAIAYSPRILLKTEKASYTFEVTEDMIWMGYTGEDTDEYNLYVFSWDVGVWLKPNEEYAVYTPQRRTFEGEADEEQGILTLANCRNYDSMYDQRKLITTHNPCNVIRK